MNHQEREQIDQALSIGICYAAAHAIWLRNQIADAETPLESMKKDADQANKDLAFIEMARKLLAEGAPEDAQMKKEQPGDTVRHPSHYTSHPSGIECIDVVQHMMFCPGNAIKYIWRAGQKGDPIEDYNKAIQYIEFEKERILSARKEETL